MSKMMLNICLSLSLIVPRWVGLLESQKSSFFNFSGTKRVKQDQKKLRSFEIS